MTVSLRTVLTILTLALAAAPCLSQTADDKQAEFAAHIQKAQQYLGEKRPELAIPELQAAAEIDPENVETQGNLGVLLYFQGKMAEAIPHLRAAVERQPGLGKIQGLLGLAEVRTLDPVHGRKDLEAAFPLIPEQNIKVEVGLELLGVCTQSGDLEEASIVAAQLRKAAPDNPEVLYAVYRTFADLSGESMLALSLAAPDSAQMHQVLAHEKAKQGNNEGAVAEYRKAIAINPHLPGIHFELAELLRTSQNAAVKSGAEQEYGAALAESPYDEKSILRLAEIDAQRGDTHRSYEQYKKAVELQPADADAKLGLAKALIEMNQKNEALPLLEEAVRLEPTNATAHYRLGTLYRQLGRAEDARKEIELYQKYKEMKQKLRAVYQELQIQPSEIRASQISDDDQNQK